MANATTFQLRSETLCSPLHVEALIDLFKEQWLDMPQSVSAIHAELANWCDEYAKLVFTQEMPDAFLAEIRDGLRCTRCGTAERITNTRCCEDCEITEVGR